MDDTTWGGTTSGTQQEFRGGIDPWDHCFSYQGMMVKLTNNIPYDQQYTHCAVDPCMLCVEQLKSKLADRLTKQHFGLHKLIPSNGSRINDGIQSNIKEIIDLEVNTMEKYLKRGCSLLRNTIYAGYTILVKMEESNDTFSEPIKTSTNINTNSKTNTNSNSKSSNIPRIPPHLCRILLIMGHELNVLKKTFGPIPIDLYLVDSPSQIKSRSRVNSDLSDLNGISGVGELEYVDSEDEDEDEVDEFGIRTLPQGRGGGGGLGLDGTSSHSKTMTQTQSDTYANFMFKDLIVGLLSTTT